MSAKNPQQGVNVEAYKQLFQQADKNNDGSLTIQELHHLLKNGGSSMTDKQITDTFIFFDGAQGDKKISFDEFAKGLDAILVFVQKLRQLFEEKDKSGDGFLDRNELTSLLQESDQQFSADDISNILKEADVNGDNKISWPEFVNACT